MYYNSYNIGMNFVLKPFYDYMWSFMFRVDHTASTPSPIPSKERSCSICSGMFFSVDGTDADSPSMAQLHLFRASCPKIPDH